MAFVIMPHVRLWQSLGLNAIAAILPSPARQSWRAAPSASSSSRFSGETSYTLGERTKPYLDVPPLFQRPESRTTCLTCSYMTPSPLSLVVNELCCCLVAGLLSR